MTKTKSVSIKSILLGIVAFLIIAGVFVGALFIGRATVKIPEPEATEEAGTIVVSDDGKPSALSIRVERIVAPASAEPVSPDSHLSYKITATYDGDRTTDKLDLTAAWENPSSAWATGKQLDTYFKLDHEDGAFEATATALQAYGETIVLTGTLRGTQITKSINLDYLAKPTQFNNGSSAGASSFSGTIQLGMGNSDYNVGSVKPTKISGTLTLRIPTDVYNAMQDKGWDYLQQTKDFDYDLLAPHAINVNMQQFSTQEISGSQLDKFNDDLYWTLTELLDGDDFSYTMTFSGTYYAMVGGVETACGQLNYSDDCYIHSYEDLASHLDDFDFGGDILFRD